MTGTGRRRGEPAAEEGHGPVEHGTVEHGTVEHGTVRGGTVRGDGAEEFAFVDDEDPNDVIDWLAFTETRTERREERRRRSRNRMVALLVLLGVLAAGCGGYLLWRVFGAGEAAGEGDRAAVLFQIRGPNGDAVANAVLGHQGGSDRGSMLVVPAALRVQPVGTQPTSLGKALVAVGPSETRSALTDLIGVPLDGSWTLEEVAFASMVDRLGGVQVDGRRLKGRAALTYATKRAPGEDAKAQTARFERLLRALFRVIPTDPVSAGRLLDDLGVIGEPSLSNQRLGAALSALAGSTDRDRVELGTLPVRKDGVVDPRRAGQVVREVFGGPVRREETGGTPRVFVQDGTGQGGEAVQRHQAAAARLLGGGYRYINGGAADETVEKTVIEVSDAVRDAKSVGEQVALTLDVPTSGVRVIQGDQIAADVVVVVGEDFRP